MTALLKDKCAIVTGAAQGIGFEIVQEILSHGGKAIINDVDQTFLDEAEKRLSSWEGRFQMHCGDASSAKVVRDMVQLSVDQFGVLDLAIANAGITIPGAFLEFPEDQLHKMFNLNLVGSFLLAQVAAQQMILQGHGGRILLLSSVTGYQAHRGLEGYSMTKAALKMLARCLGPELAAEGITVNCVAPGATETERTTSEPGYSAGWSRVIPTGRPSTAKEIAKACMFFLGPDSDQVTGQTLVVDGGWTATSPLPSKI